MDSNFYNRNRNKLLFMVRELHKLGYGNLRVIPSISPSGLAWRCVFIDQAKENNFIASTWIDSQEDDYKVEIKLSPQELAVFFKKDNIDFIEHCKGKNKEYEKWYSQMVENLKEEELPYAFDANDYFYPTDHWLTTKDNKIKTLPNEKEYYKY